MIKPLLLILITIFVFLVAGCGADLFINILLTLLGYFPGHIHAFYIEYVYIKRRDEVKAGIYNAKPAAGVYSQKVQNGGFKEGRVVAQEPVGVVPAQQGYGSVA
jgi:uncharacterized membrane protein YqaE (UPF0057 family)